MEHGILMETIKEQDFELDRFTAFFVKGMVQANKLEEKDQFGSSVSSTTSAIILIPISVLSKTVRSHYHRYSHSQHYKHQCKRKQEESDTQTSNFKLQFDPYQFYSPFI
jgi:hypothetical protein